jgi:hypothetical protein
MLKNMMNRRQHRLKEFNSKSDVNQITYTNVFFAGEQKMLPPGEINHVVNVGDEFNKERNESSLYRLIFTISPLFSNPLFNVDSVGYFGSDYGEATPNVNGNSWNTFNEDIFKKEPLDADLDDINYNYEEAIDKHLVERDGWFGFIDPDVTKAEICKFYDMEPTRAKFDLNKELNHNWDIAITYPASADTTHHVINGGLLIIDAQEVLVGGRSMVALATATYHGLLAGDRVTLSGMSDNDLDGTFRVERTGLDNGDLRDSYFVVDVDPADVAGSLGGASISGRARRNYNGELSIYYLRQFKNLMLDKDNYESYPLAFSKNIFNDQIYQLTITEDLDIAGLTDNLNRPLSELYLTFVKTPSKNNVFGPVKSGLDLEFIEGNLSDPQFSNVRRIHDGSTTPFQTHDPLPMETNITINPMDDLFYGDVVEFNRLEQREFVLADVLHRFNTINRETSGGVTSPAGPRREGYLYKPHHLVKIREFSLYVEQGDQFTGGIPDYASDLGDGRYLWRDLLDIGVFDGEGDFLDYPFTNGTHYIHSNICLKSMRQDPFGAYGLYYPGTSSDNGQFDPGDPIGDAITDKFITKDGGDVC